jgi:hypothetical protein
MIEIALLMSILALTGVALQTISTIFNRSSCELSNCFKCQMGEGDNNIELNLDSSGHIEDITIPHN